jgi:DNA-binding transcriptional ArsR family regulator
MLNQSPPVDDVFRALGDPTRRRMVERLGRGPLTVSQLAQPLDMTLSAVVQHLSVLESCGLVRSEKVGRTRTCTLEDAGLRLGADWFAGQRAAWERRLDRLGAVLTADIDEPDEPGQPRQAGQPRQTGQPGQPRQPGQREQPDERSTP